MYKFREIICFKCNHRFTHQEYSMYCSPSHYEYIMKDTEELLDYAICPQCATGMVVTTGDIGIDPNSVDVIKSAVRGI